MASVLEVGTILDGIVRSLQQHVNDAAAPAGCHAELGGAAPQCGLWVQTGLAAAGVPLPAPLLSPVFGFAEAQHPENPQALASHEVPQLPPWSWGLQPGDALAPPAPAPRRFAPELLGGDWLVPSVTDTETDASAPCSPAGEESHEFPAVRRPSMHWEEAEPFTQTTPTAPRRSDRDGCFDCAQPSAHAGHCSPMASDDAGAALAAAVLTARGRSMRQAARECRVRTQRHAAMFDSHSAASCSSGSSDEEDEGEARLLAALGAASGGPGSVASLAQQRRQQQRRRPRPRPASPASSGYQTGPEWDMSAKPMPQACKPPPPRTVACSDGVRRYACEHPQCTRNGRPFGRRQDYVKHYRIHTNERPYGCRHVGCNRHFSDPSVRTRHESTHSDKKVAKCPDCEKEFKQVGSVRRHWLKVHQPHAAPGRPAGKACKPRPRKRK